MPRRQEGSAQHSAAKTTHGLEVKCPIWSLTALCAAFSSRKHLSPQLCEVPPRASQAVMLTQGSKRPARAWPARSRHWQLYADFCHPPGRCLRGLSACSGPPGSHRQLQLSFQQRKRATGLHRKAREPRWAGVLCWVHEKHWKRRLLKKQKGGGKDSQFSSYLPSSISPVTSSGLDLIQAARLVSRQ